MTCQHFFTMGGYGVFVWPAYGLTALLLSALSLHSYRQFKQIKQRIRSLNASKT